MSRRIVPLLLTAALLFLLCGCAPEKTSGLSVPGFRERGSADAGTSDFTVFYGSWTGAFVERGTDAPCEDTAALLIRNNTSSLLERAEFSCGNLRFTVTWLPAGAWCLVQEQSGAAYSRSLSGTALTACVYAAERSMHGELVSVDAREGCITLTNISGKDIPGSVHVRYKTISDGVFLGGVSYMAGVDDGILLAGSTAEIQTARYHPETSEIICVTLSGPAP